MILCRFICTIIFIIPFMGCGISAEGVRNDGKIFPIEEIISHASLYDGKDISVCGWFTSGQEVCKISINKGVEDNQSIWVTPDSEICLPTYAIDHPRSGWAVVSGIFRTGGGYGYFGEYKNIIEGGGIELIKDSCGSPLASKVGK